MNRRKFLHAAAIVPVASAIGPLSFASFQPQENAAPNTDRPLQARYNLTLNRVLTGVAPSYSQDFLLADVRPTNERRFTEYSGDLSGRYIGALATAARVYGAQFPNLDSLVVKVIALQKPEGYFGSGFNQVTPTDKEMALLWGNGRLLVGLIEYYRLHPSAEVFIACKRLADFLLRVGPRMISAEIRAEFSAQHFASSYICWMQQTEGLANLYLLTRDERYRKLAEEIAAVIERRPGDHVHGYLTSLRGVMDLYQATGDARFLAQCQAAWHNIEQSPDALITGGVPEGWSPNNHRTEGCAEADWVRLSLALWRATAKSQYLAAAERTILNEFAFNQFSSGDFGHRHYTDTGLPEAGAARAWWCCTLHGLRCFPEIHAGVFRSQGGDLWFDLPLDGKGEAGGLSATAVSSLAKDGEIKITLHSAASAALRIRKPEWAQALSIRVNGSAGEWPVENGYVRVRRAWRSEDVVEVKYAMALRSEPSGDGRVSYSFGPWLLGASASSNPDYFNELTTQNKLLKAAERAHPFPTETSSAWMVPIAATVMEYAPAEYPVQKGTVALRPIAEQTAQPTTSWELRFLSGVTMGEASNTPVPNAGVKS